MLQQENIILPLDNLLYIPTIPLRKSLDPKVLGFLLQLQFLKRNVNNW